MSEIVNQSKDIASKVTAEALIGHSLAPFGLPHLTITGILPTNLPAIESNELRLDNLFLLNDDSLAIIDYESDFDKENFVKYIGYIARVIKRYARQKLLDSLREIRMIVIYTADVEHADCIYNLGGLILTLEAAFLVQLDSDAIFHTLSEKIEREEPLTEEELLQLMILPLTVKGTAAKQQFILSTVGLAKKLPDHTQTLRVLAGLLTFTDKVIDETYRDRIKEEMSMTKIGQMIFEEGVEKGMQQAARNMFLNGFGMEETARILGIAPSTVEAWFLNWNGKQTIRH